MAMVFEWLINVHKIEAHQTWKMLFFGFFYSFLAAIFALFILPKFAGPVMLALTMIAFVPVTFNLMREEEWKEETHQRYGIKHMLFKEHWPAMKFFIFMFIGMLVAYVVLFLFLPQTYATNLFSMQLDIIASRNVQLGTIIGSSALLPILVNNLKVLVMGLLLSLIYGVGAIFILSWNATILGALVGSILKHTSTPLVAGRFLLHGIPEITAYFIAGLAGGIISIAAARHKLTEPEFKEVVKDAIELVLLAIALMIISAFIEVYISPFIG
ncbi:MAG: stage II sporulation protein M [Candidatus Nanoarchaeia archaeon]